MCVLGVEVQSYIQMDEHSGNGVEYQWALPLQTEGLSVCCDSFPCEATMDLQPQTFLHPSPLLTHPIHLPLPSLPPLHDPSLPLYPPLHLPHSLLSPSPSPTPVLADSSVPTEWYTEPRHEICSDSVLQRHYNIHVGQSGLICEIIPAREWEDTELSHSEFTTATSQERGEGSG